VSTYADWAAELFRAADELGYYIDRMDNFGVELVPMRGNRGEVRIRFEARPLLSGALLRECLLALPEPKKEKA
jgi:hypothetical protein